MEIKLTVDNIIRYSGGDIGPDLTPQLTAVAAKIRHQSS